MNEKILNIYRSILSYAGMHVAEDGHIFFQLTETAPSKDIKIGDEPLVFQTRQQFDNPDQKRIYFHPLGENFLRGESEVVTTTREAVVIRLNYVTAVVAQYLIDLLGSPQRHKALDEEQTELLKKISEADDKSSQNWGKLIGPLLKNQGEAAFVKLYIKRSGTWRGEDYHRLGVVTFPFYEDMVANKHDHLRVKDKTVFKKIMEFMFPGLEKPETYNYGTRTRIAPFMDALMMSSGNIARRLNELLEIYEPFIPNAEELRFNMDWSEAFQDLDALNNDIRQMPELRGNAGVATVQDRQHPTQTHTATPPAPAPAPTPGAPPVPTATPGAAYQVVPTPAQPAAPAAAPQPRADGKLNFGEVLQGNAILQSVPNYMAPVMYNQWGQPMMAPQQALSVSGRTTDPSYLRPPVQQGPMGYGQPMMGQGMMPQQGVHPMYGQLVMDTRGLQPLPQGYVYVFNQMGQPTPVQMQPMQQPMGYTQQQPMGMVPVNAGAPPGGWYPMR